MKIKIQLIAAFLIATFAMEAQPSKGNPGGSPTPIGGISLLVAAGAAIGGRALYKKQQDQQE